MEAALRFVTGLPVVHDPWFWVVAVVAVLMAGISKSGFAGGLTSLATPLMAMAVPVPQAAAIMLPLLLVMDAVGLQQLWRQRDPALVKLLVVPGLAGIAVGALLFGALPGPLVSALVGALTLFFLAQRLLFPPSPQGSRAPVWVGRLCAGLSGITSFVVHAGSPPLLAYVLPLRLSPVVVGASMAVFFAAINLAKVLPYAALGLIDSRNMATAALLVPLAAMGAWLGARLLGVISPTWFYRMAYVGMLLTGLKLLFDGLRVYV